MASECISLCQDSVLIRTEKYYFIVPYCLHTACEALEGLLYEDCINVLLLQLLVLHVNVRHDLMKQLQKKMEVLILQHRQEARYLPHCGAVK